MPGASDRPVAISRPTGGWWRRFGECTQRAGARWQSTGTPVAAAAGRGLWTAPGGAADAFERDRGETGVSAAPHNHAATGGGSDLAEPATAGLPGGAAEPEV